MHICYIIVYEYENPDARYKRKVSFKDFFTFWHFITWAVEQKSTIRFVFYFSTNV